MSYMANLIRDSIQIRMVTPDSIRIWFERKRPIRRSLLSGWLIIGNLELAVINWYTKFDISIHSRNKDI